MTRRPPTLNTYKRLSLEQISASLALAVCFFAAGSASAQGDYRCGSLENSYGPFDFYENHADELRLVEIGHFTRDVEFLRKELTGPFGGDLDYALRAFPNHPRALAAMVRLGARESTDRPRGAKFSVYCYLERAVRFRPNDATARLIMASYLLKNNRKAEAMEHLDRADQHTSGSGNFHYNLGLAFFDAGDYAKSLVHAHKAIALGFDLPGLRRKLETKGKWAAPASATEAAVPAASTTRPSVD